VLRMAKKPRKAKAPRASNCVESMCLRVEVCVVPWMDCPVLAVSHVLPSLPFSLL
jgi:hypothetical protein